MIFEPLHRLTARVRAIFARGTLESEMQTEMRDHLERATVAAGATWRPARRASRVHPTIALRGE
jgi:hypothetical protein